jgi:hypothetical protein
MYHIRTNLLRYRALEHVYKAVSQVSVCFCGSAAAELSTGCPFALREVAQALDVSVMWSSSNNNNQQYGSSLSIPDLRLGCLAAASSRRVHLM